MEELFGNWAEILISADMYIVIAAVYGICAALKSAKFFDDRFIPLAAVLLGALFEGIKEALSGGPIFEGVLSGIVCGMAAVYGANIIKQVKGK